MNARDAFELLLGDWFEATAPGRPAEWLLDAVLERTARTRRRRSWQIADRWIPPGAWVRLTTARRMAFAVALLVLVVTAVVAGLIIAGSIERRPPPFGPGRPGLIAFTADDQLFVVNPDGSGRRPLTAPGEGAEHPVWSPDGLKLAYWTLVPLEPGYGSPNLATLVVVDADGTRSVVVDSARIPDASPDTRAIGPSIAATSPDNLPPLIAWAPDSERLAYALPRDGVWRIFVARSDRPGGTPIGDPALPAIHPAWSPDGRTIAFSGGRWNADPAVYLMSADGSDVRRLTTVTLPNSSPAWSPDGRTIAFTVRSLCQGEVWAIGADGTGERPIAADRAFDLHGQSWSPDGTMIAFSRRPKGCPEASFNGTVVVANADGSDARVLKEYGIYGLGLEWPVAWSPDGSSVLAFLMSSGSSRGVALAQLPVDGSEPVIIDMPGLTGQEGDWQRLAP